MGVGGGKGGEGGSDEFEELQDLLGAGEMLKALDEFAESSLREAKRLNELAQSARIGDVGTLYAAAAMDNEKLARLVKILSPILWNILTLLNSIVQTMNRLMDMVERATTSMPKSEDIEEVGRKLDEVKHSLNQTYTLMEELYKRLYGEGGGNRPSEPKQG